MRKLGWFLFGIALTVGIVTFGEWAAPAWAVLKAEKDGIAALAAIVGILGAAYAGYRKLSPADPDAATVAADETVEQPAPTPPAPLPAAAAPVPAEPPPQTADSSVHAAERGVAIGGGARRTVIVTGDHNDVRAPSSDPETPDGT